MGVAVAIDATEARDAAAPGMGDPFITVSSLMGGLIVGLSIAHAGETGTAWAPSRIAASRGWTAADLAREFNRDE